MLPQRVGNINSHHPNGWIDSPSLCVRLVINRGKREETVHAASQRRLKNQQVAMDNESEDVVEASSETTCQTD